MTEREKIIEVIAPYVSEWGDDDAIADALIAAGIGDVKVLKTALQIAECDSLDYTYDDFIEQAEKELAEERKGVGND